MPVCAKAKKADKSKAEAPAPVWLTDSGRLQMFPRAEYLSVCAYGATGDEAKNKAVADISANIAAQVQTNLDTTYAAVQDTSGVVKTRREMIQNVSTETENELFQLEFTTPYYSADYGMFACVAFINRQKAFNFIKPKLDNAAKIFPAEYEKAMQQKDSFDRILAIKNAQNVLEDFYSVYDFALAIQTNAALNYKNVDELAVLADVELGKLKNKVRLSVFAEGDYQNRIANKLKDVLTTSGYTVAENGSADYKVLAEVSYEISQNADVFQAYPSVTYRVVKGNETKFSFSKQLKKVAGFDKDTVIRRSFSAMEKALENSL